jgi:hypothetical protein
MDTTKQPRSIVMANNWKIREIKGILILRDEMVANNINESLIKKFVDEQYEKINEQYNIKIKKHNDKQAKLHNSGKKINKHERQKAINFLIQNKNFLEEHGANPEYIKKYVEKHYEDINNKYDNDGEDVNLNNVNFLD